MPISKAERLLDLVIALVNSRYYRSAAWIRSHVAGYTDATSDSAFSRMFERDKQELRDLGIPIATSPDADGYRIEPGEFALPPVSFSPAESTALALAARLWETTSLGGAGAAALRKLQDAGDGIAESAPAGAVHARIRTPDAAFAELFSAIRSRRCVRFDYRSAGTSATTARRLEPWGLVNFRGAWYTVGRDIDKDAVRTFRLSRIQRAVRTVGRADAFEVPPGIELKDYVARTAEHPDTARALVRIRPGRAAGLRRGGEVIHPAETSEGFDDVRVPMPGLDDLARRIAAHGPDVVAVDPPDLRDAVVDLLRGTVRSVERTAGR